MDKVFVNSEISKLETVIIHRPDPGIGRISPRRAEELLFDDIVHYHQMVEEHDIFAAVLQKFVGKDHVHYIDDLLAESLGTNNELREEVIHNVIDFEELPDKYFDLLGELDNQSLSKALISGYLESKKVYLFDPIPNLIFTRDIGVIIKDYVLITKAAKQARHRENFLTQFIFQAHPLFEALRQRDGIINTNNVNQFPPSTMGETVSVEGGDVMLLNENYLLIGHSERTTEHAIRSLAKFLFDREIIDNVVLFHIPNERSFMHIDTVFTIINRRDAVCYKPIVYDGMSSHIICFKRNKKETHYFSLKDFIHAELHDDVRFIFAGNGISPFQEREQWTDGCNLVCLKPGVGITYDRNPRTRIAFEEHGYQSLTAQEILDMPSVDDLENTIIMLPSAELSRARGGSHCMTFPIKRERAIHQ